MIMKKIILATLAAATVMTPVVAQAAAVPVQTSRNALQLQDEAGFQRGEGRRGEGRRGEGRRGGEGQRGGNQGWRVQQNAPPQVQEERPQPPRAARTWSQDRRNDDDSNGRYSRRNDGNQGGYRQRDRDDDGQRNWDRGRERSIERNRGDDRNNRSGYSWGRDNDNRGNGWNQGWRNDRRYDWRGHRDRYRNYYSPGRYYSPYRGHSYRRYGIGINIGSAFFGSRYWINDPSYYRLPPAYGPYRWVRYYDDVLLIDLRSGRVVDAIHDFFW
jgi:Nickel/cobalt transporter regulator